MTKKDDKNKTLSDVRKTLKKIEKESAERKAKRDVELAAADKLKRKKMSSKPMSKGSSIKGLKGLQGLQARFGSKITK